MEYYMISQEKREKDFFDIKISEEILKKINFKNQIIEIQNEPVFIFVENLEEKKILDFYDKQYYIISDEFKKILEIYDDNIFFNPIVCNDIANQVQTIKWLMIPQKIECISDKTSFLKDGKIRNLTILENKVFPNKIFYVESNGINYLIVNLEIVENILGQQISGISIKSIKKEE